MMPTNRYRPPLFAASFLIPFLGIFSIAQAKRASQDTRSAITVVIDAGHGGYDRGGIPGQRIAEKEMTLDVAQRLKKVLAASGYRVVMTRDSDAVVTTYCERRTFRRCSWNAAS
jgi:N-acetylmuramoyl-L-alanine amidase